MKKYQIGTSYYDVEEEDEEFFKQRFPEAVFVSSVKKEKSDVPEISGWQSFQNSMSNAFEMAGDLREFYGIGTGDKSVKEVAEEGNLGAYSGASIASTIIWEGIFGREKMKQFHKNSPNFFKTYNASDSKTFSKVLENFEIEKQQQKQTMTFKQADSIGDYLAVVAGAVVNVGGSVVYNLGTAGTGFFMEFAADNFIEANKVKAEAKGVSLDELIKSGEADVAAPVKIAALQAGLEYVGFSKILKGVGVNKQMNKAVGSFLTKRYKLSKSTRMSLDVLSTGKTEAFTEMGQYGLEYYNAERAKAIAEGRDINPLLVVAEGMVSEEGIESGLQGFFGGAGLRRGTYSAKSLAHIRKTVSDVDVENDLNNLVNLKRRFNQSTDEDVKAGYQEKIDQVELSLSDKIKKGNNIYKSLTNSDISNIENLGDLADVTAYRATQLNEKLSNGQISEQDHNIALAGLTKRYSDLKTQMRAIINKKKVESMIIDGNLDGKVTELSSEEISKLEKEGLDSKEASNQFGFIEQKENGAFEIFLNKDKPMEGTAAHEFMHAVLFKTIKGDTKIQTALGSALTEHVNKEGVSEAFIRRMMPYINDKNFGEETITVMSESMLNGELKFDENFMTKIGDVLRRFYQNVLGKPIKFNSGRDVYNFIKDYNKNIKDGKISPAVLKVIKEGAKGKLVEGDAEAVGGFKMSRDASENVQRIYAKKGVDGAGEIAMAYRGMAETIFNRNLDRATSEDIRQNLLDNKEDIIADILYSPGTKTAKARTVLGLVNDFKSKKHKFNNVAAYINQFLPERAKEVFKPYGTDGAFVKSMEQEGVKQEVGKVEAKEITGAKKPVKKKIVLADRLGVTDKVASAIKKLMPNIDVDNLTFKTLKNKVPNITGELFGISPKKIISGANITKGELRSAQMFINKNADLLIAMMPEGATAGGTATGVPNTLLKAFYTKTDRAKAAKTGSKAGLVIQQKKNINKKEFLELFGIVDGKPDRTDRNTSARVLALANLTGKMMTNQAVRQQVGQETAKAKETVRKLKDGKSTIMFARDLTANNLEENFRDLYEHEIGELYKQIYGEVKRVPNYKEGKNKGLRNLDAKFSETETFGDAGVRVISTFLESHPEFRELIKITMTGGKKAGFFQFVSNFNNLFPKTDIDQKYISRTKYGGQGAVYSKNHYKKLQNGELDSENKARLPLLLDFFKSIQAHLQNFPDDIWMFEEMLLDTGKQQNVFTRILAPFAFYPVKNGKPIFNQKIKEEHTDPQNLIGKAMLAAAAFGKVEEVWKVIGKSYMQGGILDSKKYPHDKMIEDAGNGSAMPDVYYEKIVPRLLNGELDLPNGYASIVRLAESGVPLDMYYLHEAGMTVTEFFKVDGIKDVKLQNKLIVQQLAGEIKPEYAEAVAKMRLTKNVENTQKLNNSINKARTISYSKDPKGITVLDFDDTLATTKSLVKYNAPDGTTGTLNAEEYASTYQDLQDQGYTFDFSEFNKVVKGKLAPLFNKALKLQGKFGPENMFVLTARPPAAQKAIYDFLKANGLNIPLKNITGLGNSTSEAKALWIADKVSLGYNDFYFADDALQNVQAVKNMLDQFDVKSKIQQAKIKFSRDIDKEFNDILENVTGIESVKRFDFIKARKRGSSKGKFRLFIPPSHEDFVGLLYNFMGKGRQGDAHRNFFEQALIRPLNRANKEYDTARQSVATDYKSLNKQMPVVKKKLIKKTPDGDFTYQDAIRVYLWDKHGYKIPGLSPIDQTKLVELVKSDGELQAYADTINEISRQEKYVDPTDGWDSGDIRMDLDDATGRIGRSQFFEEFIENADIVFSTENLNKIEAAYGKNMREALEDMLYRIKTGRNKPTGQSANVNKLMNYLNGSVGSVMFFNMRSALLQQMSIVNYINFADNNLFAAAGAFANQKQYWADWSMIFNSDMLKQRRGGIMTDVNGAELAAEMRKSKSPHRFLISKLLELGFLPTQIGDNIAIATGGAMYYRNRVNTYLKQGLNQKEAEAAAFTDFQDITQSTQQSARPDMVSQQQASVIGKVILNFQNVTSQFNRLGKKAYLDIKNRRITKPNSTQMQSDISNAARITYYFAVQNAIFYTLQTALFAMMFDDDEEDNNNLFLKKQERLINGSIDSVLRGSGVFGAVLATLKNVAIAFARQRDVDYNPDESAVIVEAFNFSPVLGIKARKVVNAEKTLNYNKKVIKEMETFDIDNPQWSAVTNYVEGFTNAPLNRLYNKTMNVRQGLSNEHAAWERTLMFLGWSQYNLNLGNKRIEEIKENIKENKKQEDELKKKEKQKEKNRKKKRPTKRKVTKR